ncbi:MAG: AAA family ATPase, partial [Clostridia bacterium]
MKIISIINLKGGVGKTVTTVNMAAELAAAAKKILVIDADPQANASAFYGLKGEDFNTVAGIMRGEGECVDEYIYDTSNENIFCVPSDITLVEADIASVTTATGAYILKGFLDAVNEDNEDAVEYGDLPYDYCIIDCPPSFTASSVAAIAASDQIIIPVKIDAFAIDGLSELTAQIDGVRQIRSGVSIAGVLVTMWQNTPAVVQGEELLRQS